MNPYPEVTQKEQKKKKLIADLVGTSVARRTVLPLKELNKKMRLNKALIKNPLKPSKYVFRSKGLPTNLTTSLNRQKLVMSSILEQAMRQMQQQRIKQRQEQRNLQQRKPQISKTSLANRARNKPAIGQVKIRPPIKRPTYIKTSSDMGKRVTW